MHVDIIILAPPVRIRVKHLNSVLQAFGAGSFLHHNTQLRISIVSAALDQAR